jgi:hypothetical protein
MVVHTILSAAIMVVAITVVGFFIGKLNRFGEKDDIIDISEEKEE